DAASGQKLQHASKVQFAVPCRCAHNIGAFRTDRLLACELRGLAGDDPERRLPRRRNQFARERQPQCAIEDNTHRRGHARQAAGQPWIGCESGADARASGAASRTTHTTGRAPAGTASARGAGAAGSGFTAGPPPVLKEQARGPGLNPSDMASMRPPRLLATDTNLDDDASLG